MRSVMMTVLVVLVSSVAALGQQYVPVVANQVVQQPVQQLPMVQPAPMTVFPCKYVFGQITVSGPMVTSGSI